VKNPQSRRHRRDIHRNALDHVSNRQHCYLEPLLILVWKKNKSEACKVETIEEMKILIPQLLQAPKYVHFVEMHVLFDVAILFSTIGISKKK
jgi:hypothetical protein